MGNSIGELFGRANGCIIALRRAVLIVPWGFDRALFRVSFLLVSMDNTTTNRFHLAIAFPVRHDP